MMDAPRWMRDLCRFLPLKSHFVLSGNVRDRYPLVLGDGPANLMPLVEYLAAQLAKAGIERSIAYEPVHGFRVPPALNRDASGDQAIFESFGLKFDDSGWAKPSPLTRPAFMQVRTTASNTWRKMSLSRNRPWRLTENVE